MTRAESRFLEALAQRERSEKQAIEQATEALTELIATRVAIQCEYSRKMAERFQITEESRLRESDAELDVIEKQLEDIRTRIFAAGRDLDKAYDEAGVEYSGSKCSTIYNMYTFRDIEREGTRLCHRRMEEAERNGGKERRQQT